MFKSLLLIIALAALTYFGLGFYGYQVHAENLPYYMPQKQEGGSGNVLQDYLDTVKLENKIHPLIAKKKGLSSADKLDKSSTKGLKQLLQVDKFEQMEKLKKDIKQIQATSDDRSKQVDAIMDGMERK